MANELKHGSVGTELTQAEWEAVGTHVVANQAVGDIIYADTTAQLLRLGIGSTANVLTVASGKPSWAAPAAAAAGSLTGSTLASGVVTTSATTVGVLNSGSINTGFGNIDVGASSIAAGSFDVSDGNITNVAQIGFLASQSASGDANTLDDYEEGSFTPSVVDTDGSDKSQSYSSNRVGRYTKIGNLVHFQLYVEMTSLGTLTTGDAASIIGLPFTADSTTGTHASVLVGFGGNLAIAAESSISGVITPNTQKVSLKLWDAATGSTNLLIQEISANGLLGVAGSYRV